MIQFLTSLLAIITAISIHEASHALAADRLGDPTSRLQGRLSLNPLRHIDPVGTILVPFFLILSRAGFVIGWAKPVIFDPFNLRNPRRDAGIIGIAGPISNLLTALAIGLLIRLLPDFFFPIAISKFLYQLADISILLAVFNLVPVHPLDGGKIITSILPHELAAEWEATMSKWGTLLLILLIFPWGGGASPIFYLVGPVVAILRLFLLPPGRGII